MKKESLMIASACFVLGMSYSFYNGDLKKQSVVLASTFLDEQIEQYEESLKEEENSFIPYSQTIQSEEVKNQNNLSTSTPHSTQTSSSTTITGISHNNISKLGQDVADGLKTLVREVLRTVVKFVDQLISD